MPEFETFNKNKRRKRSSKIYDDGGEDFISMFYDLFSSINYKVAILIFIIGLFVFSDVFIDTFLTSMNGSVVGDEATTKGTVIQLLLLTLGYIAADLMVSGGFI
jgi:hypothetical protein